jgi:hypothetical protein
MDINYLLAREQVSLMLARFAPNAATRRTHEGLAQGFGARLAESVFPHRRTGAGAVAALDLPSQQEMPRG